jgi:hemerythrin-like domain-containing protein
MARPLDAIMAFHNAFRRDLTMIDASALAWARGEHEAPAGLDRYRFFNEILVWHASGEEAVVFPLLEREAPLLAEPYIQDHHGLDAAYERLDAAVGAGDALEAARATAAFKFHLDIHLAKEDSQVYPLIKRLVHLPEERGAVGTMSGMVPRERFPEVIAWIFPLLGPTDRQNLVEVFQMLMPPEVFAPVKGLIKGVVGDDDWAALSQVLSG